MKKVYETTEEIYRKWRSVRCLQVDTREANRRLKQALKEQEKEARTQTLSEVEKAMEKIFKWWDNPDVAGYPSKSHFHGFYKDLKKAIKRL